MKKILFLCMLTLSIAGCSNDDGDGTIKPTNETIAGTWYPSKYIKADGTTVNHVGRCATKRDYLEIFNYLRISGYYYYMSCESVYNGLGCSKYYIDTKTDKMSHCSYLMNGKLTLTKTTLRIDYDVPTTEPSANMFDAVSMIFTKE